MYLQSLKPLAVGVHEPGPLCGTQGRGHPPAGLSGEPVLASPRLSGHARPPRCFPPPARVLALEESPGRPYLAASSLPPQTQTGGQIQGRCTGEEKTKSPKPRTSASVAPVGHEAPPELDERAVTRHCCRVGSRTGEVARGSLRACSHRPGPWGAPATSLTPTCRPRGSRC